jgi:hypothetical protein
VSRIKKTTPNVSVLQPERRHVLGHPAARNSVS